MTSLNSVILSTDGRTDTVEIDNDNESYNII